MVITSNVSFRLNPFSYRETLNYISRPRIIIIVYYNCFASSVVDNPSYQHRVLKKKKKKRNTYIYIYNCKKLFILLNTIPYKDKRKNNMHFDKGYLKKYHHLCITTISKVTFYRWTKGAEGNNLPTTTVKIQIRNHVTRRLIGHARFEGNDVTMKIWQIHFRSEFSNNSI